MSNNVVMQTCSKLCSWIKCFYPSIGFILLSETKKKIDARAVIEQFLFLSVLFSLFSFCLNKMMENWKRLDHKVLDRSNKIR